mmetsp:Transcript_10708/g.24853  ORF Transcript_10708/g.24853 Transcript_10708/m.24853 type:complete len:278 (-) Transcript_10708:172-1005(-)
MDALQMHQEMKQMDSMKESDIRISATTLSKAIRQSSHKGNGIVTGAPVDPYTGNIPTPKNGGSLRYKIVPSVRQLFYAARCHGRERVGLLGETPRVDSDAVSDGFESVISSSLRRRRDSIKNPGLYAQNMQGYRHMEGKLGIPVFYAPQLRKRLSKAKQLLTGTKEEIPMFFNYEDMMETWIKMRKKNPSMPARPSGVEVFNLMDVLTAMDNEEWEKRETLDWRKPVESAKKVFRRPKQPKEPGLESITFIPPKYSVEYKEKLSALGNGKARLRPMR